MHATTADTAPAATDRLTVGALLRRHAAASPRRPLSITGGARLEYGDAASRSALLARTLVALGVGRGTHVALLLPDGPRFVVGLLAAARIGAVTVPIPATPATTSTVVRDLLVHSDARVLVTIGGGLPRDLLDDADIGPGGTLWCPAVPQLRHVLAEGDADPRVLDPGTAPRVAELVDDRLLAAVEDDVTGSDPLAVVYVPDRDDPLGAVHTHEGLLGRQRILDESGTVRTSHCSLARIEGFSALLGALADGATLRSDAGSAPAGDPPPAATETGGGVFVPSGDGRTVRPVPGFRLRVVDPGCGTDVPVGEIGELWVRGPHLMLGYHRRRREDSFDRDGWFHTGTCARIVADGAEPVDTMSPLHVGTTTRTLPEPAETTMHLLVTACAARHPDVEAVVDRVGRLTYGELDSTTRELAAALVESGVGKGTRVGLLMPNGTEWVRIAVALTRIGAVLVPLSTMLRRPELRAALRVAAVQQVITVDEFRGRRYLDDLPPAETDVHDPDLPALRRIRRAAALSLPVPGRAARLVAEALATTVTPADTLAVMFTSGSRGVPKGVVHSHGSAFGAVRSGLGDRCIDSSTRVYLPMPLFWVGGFGGGLLSALLAGATLVTEDIPSPDATLALLRRERVTLFRGWPDQAEVLARHAESTGEPWVATLRGGSLDAMLSPELRSRPGARANLFGMTESFGPYCGFRADTDMPETAWGSCGRPFRGIEVRIVEPRDGTPCPAGTVGMIRIRGPHILRGLYGRGREDVFTPDGFYVTGDLGHLDHDGFLFHHGRSDDMFKVSGATVYPAEVEHALRGIDGVRGAFVTDVPGANGPRVAAAVVRANAAITAESLRASAREALSPFKVPTLWALLDSDEAVPRGSTGKIDLVGLRNLFSPV